MAGGLAHAHKAAASRLASGLQEPGAHGDPSSFWHWLLFTQPALHWLHPGWESNLVLFSILEV